MTVKEIEQMVARAEEWASSPVGEVAMKIQREAVESTLAELFNDRKLSWQDYRGY